MEFALGAGGPSAPPHMYYVPTLAHAMEESSPQTRASALFKTDQEPFLLPPFVSPAMFMMPPPRLPDGRLLPSSDPRDFSSSFDLGETYRATPSPEEIEPTASEKDTHGRHRRSALRPAASASSIPSSQSAQAPASTPKQPRPTVGSRALPSLPAVFFYDQAWRCPFPNCNKRYLQSAGLRYHFQHAHLLTSSSDSGDLGLVRNPSLCSSTFVLPFDPAVYRWPWCPSYRSFPLA
eukprot:m.69417 g.69417  ORF g.69417 m.69417 type:complete len:235 (-) comp50067_c0_seq11:623-1327(-)